MVCLYIVCVCVCWNSCFQARLYNHAGFVAIRCACTPRGTDQRHWPAGSCKVQHLQLLGEAVLWPAVGASSVAGCPSLWVFSVDHEVPLAAATTFRTLSSFAFKWWSRYLKKVLPRLSWVMTEFLWMVFYSSSSIVFCCPTLVSFLRSWKLGAGTPTACATSPSWSQMKMFVRSSLTFQRTH